MNAAAALAAALVLAAPGAPPAIRLPPWPLSPDGDVVALTPGAPLQADGARAEPLAPGLWRVVPAPGVREVVLVSGAARRVAPVGAPPGRVEIAVTPGQPVKGRDREVALVLTVRDASGAVDAGAPSPVVSAAAGHVGAVAPDGPGRFTARFEPSPARWPEVAIVVALVPRCPLCPTPRAVGAISFPVAAAITLPGRAEPGVRTTLEVGGRSFGPVTADARGRFSVDVVVPPGARTAIATSVDAIGNRNRTTVDLGLPAVDRLACAAWPSAVPADGSASASLWCLATEPGGAPVRAAALAASARRGVVGPLEPGPGALQHATYRAPVGGGGRADAIEIAFPGGGAASCEAVEIALATGAPAALEARLARDPVPLGAIVAADTAVRDARGDLLGAAHGPAGARQGFVAPDRFVARAAPAARSETGEGGREPDWIQRAPLAFELAPGREAASLSIRRDGRQWVATARTVDARAAAGVVVRFGSGARVTTDAAGEARAPASGDEETVEADGGARAAGWADVAPPATPVALVRTVDVPLRPPSPIEVVARLDAGTLRFEVDDADGRPVPGRRVVLRAEGVTLGPPSPDGAGQRCAVAGRPGRIAVVDAETGVAALVEVR
ncbi:hypothetical protein [Anaeromyxobacter oryzae]|uniref:Bacterial Ig domain-containing protein n=1 Tax=Anaeromyxobacter oryzae TaxID=2918170 RepID=A0ABN6N1P7_9BACT|nr:hypothetical protein [Anaeromyxobacter oryzae]BDG06826.1 hypothetical protein AMOR_58220 [Anaeromyxobacter oryzae]